MKLMVIDGNSIVNRAYYGIRPLTTRDGLYTHAIFGFLTTLLRLKSEEEPDALCVTFDVHAPTFRHQADEAYKATRKGMPEELQMQMPVLKEVLDSLSIPRYEMAGWEADDLIGTISRKCEAAGWECVVVTGDKDSLQLITDKTKVKLVSTRMGQTTTKDMTEETFRADPEGTVEAIHLWLGDLKNSVVKDGLHIFGQVPEKKLYTNLLRTLVRARNGNIPSLNDAVLTAQGYDPQAVMESIYGRGRDNARTPMQWTAGENAGFTTGKPWLPVNENHSHINVEAALADPDSVFHYYRKLIALRKTYDVFRSGRFTLLLPDDAQRFVYRRDTETEHLLVVCNFSENAAPLADIEIPENAKLMLTNYAQQEETLKPYEARLYFWA